ncbi:MAG: hypothetical protein RIB45_05925 [Marivibrio sp.]|uniref:hypothetical protein n=1 Tax=Marivibrio sp. TaxID=2039719 RepID=UPI0032EE214E
MSAPLFTRYLAVDWSAAATPKRGADSIWIAEVARDADGRVRRIVLENPPTRDAATARLIEIARARLAGGQRVLIGFDFPFGYPRGTAAALGLAGGLEWRKLWARIDAALQDGPDNANNRFDVAAGLNADLTGEAFPFWGCPEARASTRLKVRGRRARGPDDLPERRMVEGRVRRTQPVWKLAGVGAVGGQALTGIPRVWAIRTDAALAFRAQIWPFETGLTHRPDGDLILAELYPSLVEPEAIAGKPKDAGQVSAVAKALARLDAAGDLGRLFAGDPTLSPEERADVEREEAWILGVAGAPALSGGRAAA